MTRLGQHQRKNQEDFDRNVEGEGTSTASEEDTQSSASQRFGWEIGFRIAKQIGLPRTLSIKYSQSPLMIALRTSSDNGAE